LLWRLLLLPPFNSLVLWLWFSGSGLSLRHCVLLSLLPQPLFVTLALSTLLARPSSSDRDPHVSVGYINDLISIEGLDYITSAAMQGLLRDRWAL
jgi:hypothetical protein